MIKITFFKCANDEPTKHQAPLVAATADIDDALTCSFETSFLIPKSRLRDTVTAVRRSGPVSDTVSGRPPRQRQNSTALERNGHE